jgi:hypothetical protein
MCFSTATGRVRYTSRVDAGTDALRAVALKTGREGFIARYPLGFLMRRPSRPEGESIPAPPMTPTAKSDWDDDDEGGFGFSTKVFTRREVLDKSFELSGEAGLVLIEIQKRAGNPNPDRVSVGRAKNCDVILRLTGVSKLHAHFYLVDGKIAQLADYRSSNGTFVNGQRLQEGQPVAVKFGDRVRFGTLELSLVTPGVAFAILNAM